MEKKSKVSAKKTDKIKAGKEYLNKPDPDSTPVSGADIPFGEHKPSVNVGSGSSGDIIDCGNEPRFPLDPRFKSQKPEKYDQKIKISKIVKK